MRIVDGVVEREGEFFLGKPFKIRLDVSRSLRTLVRDVIAQAEERQRSAPGMQYAGAVMQHLVGAKLDCALSVGQFEHHSFSTSDAQSGRAGDFFVGDVAVHITTAPAEAVIERCRDNLDAGHRPIIVTTARGGRWPRGWPGTSAWATALTSSRSNSSSL